MKKLVPVMLLTGVLLCSSAVTQISMAEETTASAPSKKGKLKPKKKIKHAKKTHKKKKATIKPTANSGKD